MKAIATALAGVLLGACQPTLRYVLPTSSEGKMCIMQAQQVRDLRKEKCPDESNLLETPCRDGVDASYREAFETCGGQVVSEAPF